MSEKATTTQKISIALCTYNGAKFLPAQLESFLAQTRQPDEIVVCDDNSPDETAAVVQDFARRAAFPVKLIVNEKNLGSTKNFEKAINLCAGDLIFLSDQDDVWLPAKIELTEREFARHPQAGMVFSDAEIVGENLEPTGRTLWSYTFAPERRRAARQGDFFRVLLSQNAVTGATMAFRAQYRQMFTPVPENIPNLIHDGWISLVIANAAQIVFIEKPLIKYRQHAAQQLGINHGANATRQLSARVRNYQSSAAMFRAELERVRQMEEVVNLYPQFAARRQSISFAALREEKISNIAHLEARIALPPNRLRRVVPVLKEAGTGRYHRFSKGFLSAFKDLLEKWEA